MKKIITIITMILFMNSVLGATIPKAWYLEGEEETPYKSSELKSLEKMLDQINKVQLKTLGENESTDQKGLFGYGLVAQKTELALSKKGILGLSAMGAKSAVELLWKKYDNKKSIEKDDDTFEVTTDMSNEEVVKSITPSLEVALSKIDPDKRSKTKSKLIEKVNSIHNSLKDVANLGDDFSWQPTAFRMDLAITHGGNLFGYADLSGAVRVRLNWKINPSSKNKKSDQKTIKRLITDLEKADRENKEINKTFKLSKIGVGLGLSKKNIFSLTKNNGSVTGYLFFEKKAKSNAKELLDGNEKYSWLENDNGNQKFLGKFFTSKRLRKGFNKAYGIGNKMVSSLERKTTKWKVAEVKLQFSLSYSGFLGLTGTSSNNIFELYYKRI